MRSFVFLTSEIYPNADANGVCVQNLAKELCKRGHRVLCIASGTGEDTVADGIAYRFVKPSLMMRWGYSLAGRTPHALEHFFYRCLHTCRKLACGIFLLPIYPNVAPLRARRFYRELCKVQEEMPIDGVFACFSPYESIAAVNRFKKKHPTIFTAVLYLDLLRGRNPFGSRLKPLFERLCQKSERKTLQINDKIWIPQNGKEFYSAEEYAFARGKMGFFEFPLFRLEKEASESNAPSSEDSLHIVYAGSVDGDNRRAGYFLQLVETINREKRTTHPVRVSFLGSFRDTDAMEKWATADFVTFLGQVPYQEVFGYLQSANVLLNISNRITYKMLPSKIFQLFASGKKIINMVASEQDAALPYFRRYPKVCNIPEYQKNPERDAETLAAFLEAEDLFLDAEVLLKRYQTATPEYVAENLIEFTKEGKNANADEEKPVYAGTARG